MGRDGRPSGDCFVRFRESVDMEKGLKKDRATMQRRYHSFSFFFNFFEEGPGHNAAPVSFFFPPPAQQIHALHNRHARRAHVL
jgi:hypothetical protein